MIDTQVDIGGDPPEQARVPEDAVRGRRGDDTDHASPDDFRRDRILEESKSDLSLLHDLPAGFTGQRRQSEHCYDCP
jgi:hypothetical protein